MRKGNVIILLERNQHNSKSVFINKSVSRAMFYEQTALIYRQVHIMLALYIMLTVTASLFP